MSKETIDSAARRLLDLLPQGALSLRDDLEKNFRATLQASLARMDLVTREEFDVQTAVLARTRELLEDVEKRLRDLEADLKD